MSSFEVFVILNLFQGLHDRMNRIFIRLCPAVVLLSDNEFRDIDVLIEALLLYADEGYVELMVKLIA